MSIIALKKSLTQYSKNHSVGNAGFSVWASTNSGNYNGSRIISGFQAVQTPFKGTSARGNIYDKKVLHIHILIILLKIVVIQYVKNILMVY